MDLAERKAAPEPLGLVAVGSSGGFGV